MSNVPLSFVDTTLCLLKSIRKLESLRNAHLDSFRRASLTGEGSPPVDPPEPTGGDTKRWSQYDRIYRVVLSLVHSLLDFDSVTELHNGYMALLLGGEVPPELRGIFRRIRKLDQDQAALARLAEAVQPVAAELGISQAPQGINVGSLKLAETTQNGTTKHKGRLLKDESETKKRYLLALLRQHVSLKDDPKELARLVGVSESTARRWLNAEEQTYLNSRAANPADTAKE